MKSEYVFKEFDTDEIGTSPEIFELNIVSGGCRLYGYLLSPDQRMEKPYPTIIMSHGFPGYTTNNDLELALMRCGCVVIHMNHRGAWGSEGNYLFTNLKDDLIAIAKYVHNSAIADQYDIDTKNIFLVGHSMGGQAVLNAAKELPFIRGVAALAVYDIMAAFRYRMEKDLFLMIETEGQCLKMNSASEVYENALNNQYDLGILNEADRLARLKVLLIEASLDTVAPADRMIRPLFEKLNQMSAAVTYETIVSTHSFAGQRMKLAKTVARWIESSIDRRVFEQFPC